MKLFGAPHCPDARAGACWSQAAMSGFMASLAHAGDRHGLQRVLCIPILDSGPSGTPARSVRRAWTASVFALERVAQARWYMPADSTLPPLRQSLHSSPPLFLSSPKHRGETFVGRATQDALVVSADRAGNRAMLMPMTNPARQDEERPALAQLQ